MRGDLKTIKLPSIPSIARPIYINVLVIDSMAARKVLDLAKSK
jgi:DNA-binding transcriptional regulator LsrR (DeoR family)